MDADRVFSLLTTEEKAALVAGTDFMYTNPVPRLGIPSLRTSDGPHGLRVQAQGGDNGVTGSEPATAFPTAATVASGWNLQNAYKIGQALGREAHKYGVRVVLGPGANIKRNPMAGRNFEYFSEDPLLAGKMAAAEVAGLQGEGVGACVKHFALNNAENYRFMGNSIADERAMREIYLKVFEIAVKEAHPAAMMCAYNRINGEYCAQNRTLLSDILRKEWGFGGLVMTDWGAMHDRIASLKAGLDLEMPGDTAICRKWIVDGIQSGALSMDELDEAVKNVLALVEKYCKDVANDCDFEQDDALACEIAKDCAVLLKNDGTLPLAEGEKLFVCGDLFKKMRYQGAGSSMINPTAVTAPQKAFDEMGIRYVFARGYAESGAETEQKYIDEALALSAGFEKAVVFAGLTDLTESEGCDRADMRLPQNQIALVDALIGAGKKVVLVLFGGSPVELPFAEEVSAVLDMYLPGQCGGKACADLLFGRAEPAGRLAETWPMRGEDVPFTEDFAKTVNEVYKESVFVGYRYYATADKKVRFPFGYGLSYTDFAFSDCTASLRGEIVDVRCTVKNTGARRGAEVVQAYVGMTHSAVFRPRRELKAFKKVYLNAGESAEVTLHIPVADLSFWNARKNAWQVEGGRYRIELCKDAFTPVFAAEIDIGGESAEGIYSPAVLAAYKGARLEEVTDALFEEMSGRTVPPLPAARPVTLNSRFSDLAKAGWMGKILYSAVLGVANRQKKAALKLPEGTERDNKIKGAVFLHRILESNSLLSMSMSAGRSFPYNVAQGFAELANGHLFRGLRRFCTGIGAPALPKEKEE